jgi:hypothetical protein
MSYWFRQRLMKREIVTKFNENHDPANGQFTSGGSSQGMTLERTALIKAAHALVDKATAEEPKITQDIQKHTPANTKLEGLDFRLKQPGSTRDKLDKYIKEEGKSLSDAVASIKDLVRYTAVIPHDSYISGVKQTLDNLTHAGYKITSFRNTWNNPTYKGINTNLTTPTGQVVELQFHTPESFNTKMSNHHDYELERHPDATQTLREETTARMNQRVAALKVPSGAVGYHYG